MARMTPTWVYVMTCREHTKIGIATNVAARVRGLQGSNPFTVAVHGTRLFADYSLARTVEQDLHDEFAEHRGYGEWFLVEPTTAMAALERWSEPRQRPPKPDPNWTDAERRLARALSF